MKFRKALLAIPALVPAAIVPLTTTTSCSQVWGYKTPISIGSNIKGGSLDPFGKFADSEYENLVDRNGEAIVAQLQSNFAIDNVNSTYYGYSLPQKWVATAAEEEKLTDPAGTINWTTNGEFVDGSAEWTSTSSSVFTTSNTKKGSRKFDSGTETKDVSETKYSYRNNILSSNIGIVGSVASAINQYLNYALQYQGSQLGTKYIDSTENNTDLAYAWGGSINHGQIDSQENRNLFESIFAANSVAGTGKAQAAVRPSHVEFQFQDLPFACYNKNGNGYVVSGETKKLLNGQEIRPGEVKTTSGAVAYWTSQTNDYETTWTENIRTGKREKGDYIIYKFENVPVRVRLNSYAKTYVNPTIKSGYQVSDFYSTKNAIESTVGNSWKGTLSKYSTYGNEVPTSSSFQFNSPTSDLISINPKATSEQKDDRLSDVKQNDFIVLLTFQYRECQKYYVENGTTTEYTDAGIYDTVTMSEFSNIFPAYMLDSALDFESFFKKANSIDGLTSGYIIDSSKVNTYNNKLLSLVKKTSKESMQIQHASQLSDESKKLLKLLAYMFGEGTNLEVKTKNCITTTSLE